MAHIDNLVASITDATLRAALEEELRKLSNQRQFGLVFNEHKPESILLHQQTRIRRGDKVHVMVEDTHDRTQIDRTGVWVVDAVVNGTARLQDKADRDVKREVPTDRCVPVREFGDPIFPGLRSTGRLQHGGDKPFHAVINGENFHALQSLLYPYEGKVDAIYVDPPYNTGARDWKYNNDYVDDNDPFRHSKWLSFMQKRLELAGRLLNPRRSVLVVTIDEKEVHTLGLLISQVFPSARIQMVSVNINPAAVARVGMFGRSDEYYFFVMIGEAGAMPLSLTADWITTKGRTHRGEIRWDLLRKSGSSPSRRDRPNGFYPILVTSDGARIVEVGEPLSLDVDKSSFQAPQGSVAIWPIRDNGTEGRWRLEPASLRTLITGGFVRLGKFKGERTPVYYLAEGERKKVASGMYEVLGHSDDGSIITSVLDSTERISVPTTQWRIPTHDSTQYGSRLLGKLLPDRKFPFPKSLYAVEDALRFFIGDLPDALVLDFFAGSGTTAHAVMRLNHQDGGHRRSIMVTNNEVSPDEASVLRAAGHFIGSAEWKSIGICENITVPRLTAAVTGVSTLGEPIRGDYHSVDAFPMADGLDENIEFFELTYEDPGLVSLGRKFHAVAPLLWLMAGAQGPRVDAIDTDKGWAIPDGGTYGVLFEPEHWSDFALEVNARADSDQPLTHTFIVTDADTEYRQVISKLPSGVVTQRLYRDYLRNFEINTVD
ncbi:site-specific DNA-methyltransferase [Knoellia subterranea]|uniref:DNA methyltransferase n=1 Tax=Knoellia subterranea KCTC 19937 TaxID=1385521 RepID=A0A0A0JQ22_9MICO|nr:DNA methyltransferase [Knoellia subterranea]KGN39273.1 DNA methyltransferase [Knoellia subterranea KCTC 19937]